MSLLSLDTQARKEKVSLHGLLPEEISAIIAGAMRRILDAERVTLTGLIMPKDFSIDLMREMSGNNLS